MHEQDQLRHEQEQLKQKQDLSQHVFTELAQIKEEVDDKERKLNQWESDLRQREERNLNNIRGKSILIL